MSAWAPARATSRSASRLDRTGRTRRRASSAPVWSKITAVWSVATPRSSPTILRCTPPPSGCGWSAASARPLIIATVPGSAGPVGPHSCASTGIKLAGLLQFPHSGRPWRARNRHSQQRGDTSTTRPAEPHCSPRPETTESPIRPRFPRPMPDRRSLHEHGSRDPGDRGFALCLPSLTSRPAQAGTTVPVGQGWPAWAAGARAVRTWPVSGPVVRRLMLSSKPSCIRQSAASMYSVRPSSPPSVHANPARSSGTVSSTSPPSATRRQAGPVSTQPGVHTAPSVSRTMPSPGSAAHTRRFDRLPSGPMSNAVSVPPNDSETISVESSGVTAIPLGNAIPSATVHDDLVEARAETAQVGVVDQGAVGLLAQQPALGPGNHQQPPVRQPVDRERNGGRHRGHHLGGAVEIDRQDLLRPPVGQPQPAIVPARRLADLQPGQQDLGHRGHSSASTGTPVTTDTNGSRPDRQSCTERVWGSRHGTSPRAGCPPPRASAGRTVCPGPPIRGQARSRIFKRSRNSVTCSPARNRRQAQDLAGENRYLQPAHTALWKPTLDERQGWGSRIALAVSQPRRRGPGGCR